jgi:alkanesulfonate monooxygenase
MGREIRLNAFSMNCVAHQSPGLWRHPRDRSSDYNRLSYWTDLAQTLERGKFDGLFLADVLGVYDVYGEGPRAALREAAQVPVNDPLLLVSAMAHVTRHLGFGVTCNLSYEPPYTFARRMTTLDHLTGGRIGWNVVTGYLDSAARGAGRMRQTGHDERYDAAEEYMEVVYKLWQQSWADDAAVRDRAAGIFADPDKVRRVIHHGAHYDLDAIHLCEPSPQRTPVIYQAGTSPKGREFAARHAECVFVSGPSAKVIAPRVADIRRLAVENGRRRDTRGDPDRTWTVRQVAEHVAIGGIGPVVIGSPAQVADALEAWIEATDVDGFNMCFALAPETFADIAGLLVPELQRRGRYKRDYAGGTLREKLFAAGPRPKRSHPASRYSLSAVARAAE